MPGLGVETDGQHKIDLRHLGDQRRSPGGRALPTRRQVGAACILPRKTEAHGQYREIDGIVEFLG